MPFVEIILHLLHIYESYSPGFITAEQDALSQTIQRLSPLLTAREVELLRSTTRFTSFFPS